MITCASVVSCDTSDVSDTSTTQPGETIVETPTTAETKGEETDVAEHITTSPAEETTTESTGGETTEGAAVETTEETKAETTEETKAETTEETKAETTEETKAETTEETKAETTEETKAETTEETKAETTEETKAETTEETKAETTEETKTETTEETKAETTEETKAETTEETKTETTEGSKEEITEETVTTVEKSEWENLFSADNVALFFEGGMINQCYRYDGANLYIHMEYMGDSEVMFIEHPVETGEYWITGEEYFEGNWVRYLDNKNGAVMFAIRADYFNSLADDYDAFTYDSDTKTYIADTLTINNSGFEYTVTDVSVQIENGKLIEVRYVWGSYTILIKEVGAVEFEMPTVDCEVTEEEWNAIWTGDDFINVEVRLIGEYGSIVNRAVEEMNVSSFMYFTENAISIDYGAYIVKSQGVWYELIKGEGEYECVERTEQYVEEHYMINGTIGAELSGKYASFTYDAENECYVGELYGQECRIYFANGKVAFIESISAESVKTAYMFCYYGTVTERELGLPEVTLPDGTVIGQ